MTSSWFETVKGNDLGRKGHPLLLGSWGHNTVTGRSCSNWFSNAIRSWWTSWVIESREKREKAKGSFPGFILSSWDIKEEYNRTHKDLSTVWLKNGWTGRSHVYSWWLVKGNVTFWNLFSLRLMEWNWRTNTHTHLPQPYSHLQFYQDQCLAECDVKH